MAKKHTLANIISSVLSFILRLLFPPKCIVCKDLLLDNVELCPECLAIWERARRVRCPVCHKTARACSCRTFHMMDTDDLGERHISALAYYEKFGSFELTDLMVLRVVYSVKTDSDRSGVTFCARELSGEILKTLILSKEKPSDYKITYPPRSRKRSVKYGFDHGKDLAKKISEYTGIPFEETLVHKGDLAQKSLNALERKANAKEAYSLKKGVSPSGKYILVDDVITTGATVNTCARILKNAGAETVYPVCIARSKKKKRKLRRPSNNPWFQK